MSNQDYFAKDFDPTKVTIKRLKEILNAHDIPYKDISRKAEFVQKFQEHVLPELQRKEEKEQEICTEQRTGKRKNVTEQNIAEEDIISSVSKSQIKTPNQRKRKAGRASSRKQKEETITQPQIIQDDGQSSKAIVIDDDNINNTQLTSISQELLRQNSERISPPRPLKAPTSETPFYPMVPPYSRTPAYPFLEPEELEKVKLREKELQVSSETTLYPIQEGSENRGDKIKHFERREAFAYCYKPRAPKKNIDRRPPPEFIKRKQKIRLSSGIIFLIFLTATVMMLLKLKAQIGFCNSINPDQREDEGSQSSSQLIISIMCTQCPHKAMCSNGMITECEKGFKRETSLFRLAKPYYTHCVIDKDQMTKARKYTKEFKEIIAREMGKVECGYEDRDSLTYENLVLQLENMMPPQDYEYINTTYENILLDDDIFIENEDGEKYIFSKKPTFSFYCQLTFAIAKLTKKFFDNLSYSFTIVSTSSLLIFGFWYIRQRIWERRQVSSAFGLALTRLSEEKRIIGQEFREEAFAHVKDPMVRQKLFQKLDEKVRTNPYVRAGNTLYGGFETGIWEWKAPYTSHVNPR
ncbi:related to sister chromatid separation protein [Rhizophagus clarus]|uniref:Related to sister chromatid separation protein n=1 Tax=Rhizophagus clarus TaxID=94130 RepID=A0A8H3R971_9GLOM|nr:related to sister chromatid separation protein [Rhizophagus clarus]